MSGEFSANPDDDFETEWHAERRYLRAQLAAAQEENVNLLAANRDLKLHWGALKSDHDAAQEEIKLKDSQVRSWISIALDAKAELAKVTELLREMFESFCNSVVENDDQTDRRRAVWSDIHAYLNQPDTKP